jgi:hypothetical protein
MEIIHTGLGSSFADPKDVIAYLQWYHTYLGQGKSKEEAENLAYAKGDNGVGCWGDSTVEGSGPSCALPPEVMAERWGLTPRSAFIKTLSDQLRHVRNKEVKVEFNDKIVVCKVKDRMPHLANITNNAIIDINADAWRALGKEPPMLTKVSWYWAT